MASPDRSDRSGRSGRSGARASRGNPSGGGDGSGRRPARRDQRVEAMKARTSDLDQRTFHRRRAVEAARREARDRQEWQPGPPDDDDYVVADRTQVRRITGTPELLGDVLADVLDNRNWNERLRAAVLFDDWEAVVGSNVAHNCEPVRLVGGVLVVAATTPSWATQLQYLAPKVALSVNKALGEPVVERVEVTVQRGKGD